MRVSIAELLEAIQECMDQGWAYNSCNQCLKFVKLVDKKFHCQKCRSDVSASPRYKLHLQVIDDTGSTTFTLFNTLVETYVGRSATDLIRSYENRPLTADTPAEFQPMIGKQYLFKVQVADINVRLGWQTFTVKKFTSEESIIQRFIQLHKLKGYQQVDEEEFHDAACEIEDIVPDVIGLPAESTEVNQIALPIHPQMSQSQDPSSVIDLSDSPSNTSVYGKPVFLSEGSVGRQIEALFTSLDETPPTKNAGKRPLEHLDALDLHSMDFSPESASKLPRNLPNPTMKK